MVETALLGLCAAGVKFYASEAPEGAAGIALEIGGELTSVVFAHRATEEIHQLQARFVKWIGEDHPAENEDIERAVTGSAILADLFCPMEAEPGTIEDHEWLHRAKSICPKALLGAPPFGLFTSADVAVISKAKTACKARLETFGKDFKPAGFHAWGLRAALGSLYLPDSRVVDVGFRCVRE